MIHASRYQPPWPRDTFAVHLQQTLHDPYGLGCRVLDPQVVGPHYQCRHTAIYAVSVYPALGLVQFSNPDGLALPLVVPAAGRLVFEKQLAGYGRRRHLGHVRGHGRFALALEDFGPGVFMRRCPQGGPAVRGEWASFATYYLVPSLEEVRFLQDGPYPGAPEDERGEHPAQPEEAWRALCAEREEVRAWLAGDPKPVAGQVATLPISGPEAPASDSRRAERGEPHAPWEKHA